jgi:hypothetical protein
VIPTLQSLCLRPAAEYLALCPGVEEAGVTDWMGRCAIVVLEIFFACLLVQRNCFDLMASFYTDRDVGTRRRSCGVHLHF